MFKISEFPIIIPKHVTLKNKYCLICGSENLFEYTPTESKVLHKCPFCSKIEPIEIKTKIQELDAIIASKRDYLIETLEKYNRRNLLVHLYQFQLIVAKKHLEDKSVSFHNILTVAGMIEYVLKYTISSGILTRGKELASFGKSYKKIIELEDFKIDLENERAFEDKNGNTYFSYNYLRRIDGAGEFGIGPRADVKNILKKYKDDYEKELEKYLRSEKRDIFIDFRKNEPVILNFYSSFYYAIQFYKQNISRLNLKWIKDNKIDVIRLQKWRINYFGQNFSKLGVKKTKESLEKYFDKNLAVEIFTNLIASISRPSTFPYGIEIEGFVHIAPSWAYYLEILFITELEGERSIKTLQDKFSQDFEKDIVPRTFNQLGFTVTSGHKEKGPEGVKFEVDCYILDKKGTLWVVEVKSKSLNKRFFESYESWFKACRTYVDRPKKRIDFPKIVEIIKSQIQSYQKNNILPKSWKINDVKGMVVMQIPPFEEFYKSIHLVWYRELEEFFDVYYRSV